MADLHRDGPGYWMNETSGLLKAVVVRYLERRDLFPDEVGILRAYLKQWATAPVWRWADEGPELPQLIEDVEKIQSRDDVDRWIESAMEIGMDPL